MICIPRLRLAPRFNSSIRDDWRFLLRHDVKTCCFFFCCCCCCFGGFVATTATVVTRRMSPLNLYCGSVRSLGQNPWDKPKGSLPRCSLASLLKCWVICSHIDRAHCADLSTRAVPSDSAGVRNKDSTTKIIILAVPIRCTSNNDHLATVTVSSQHPLPKRAILFSQPICPYAVLVSSVSSASISNGRTGEMDGVEI